MVAVVPLLVIFVVVAVVVTDIIIFSTAAIDSIETSLFIILVAGA